VRFLDYFDLMPTQKPRTAEEQAKIGGVVTKLKELAKDWEVLPGFPVVMRRRTKPSEEK
jgi:hypothetical protein